MKHNQKEKMLQEINIHRSLSHPNVVRFLSFFDDNSNVYIILELCKQRSMMELHRRRPVVTDYECRFYIHQILGGVRYLHDNKIIHRDLKLGNLFLNDQLNVKIGDFGLATRIEFDGERKKTLCGTPNYIAPEILNKKGHSYEVDIWSIGCVMFTLLVGQPPFETKTLKDTYSKIKKCDYRLPHSLRKPAADMIMAMLRSDPEKRPSVHDCAKYPFLTDYFIPKYLPVSCLTCEPRLDQLEGAEKDLRDMADRRRPLLEINGDAGKYFLFFAVLKLFKLINSKMHLFLIRTDDRQTTFLRRNLNDQITAAGAIPKNNIEYKADVDSLYLQLTKLLNDRVS